MHHLLDTSRDVLLAPLQRIKANIRRRHIRHILCEHGMLHEHAGSQSRACIYNETNLTGGENVGGASVAPSAPDAADDGDDDGGGDGDPDPDRCRSRARNTSKTSPSGTSATAPDPVPDALTNFPLLPDDAHVRLPVVCGLFACSPATAWRRAKAGIIPAPVKLSDRVTAWRVGDLRAALAELRA